MARQTTIQRGQLTPERAREGYRWVRLTVLASVLQAWMIVAVLSLSDPRLLLLVTAFGVSYSLVAPLLLRYLHRDINRRVVGDGAIDAVVSVMQA